MNDEVSPEGPGTLDLHMDTPTSSLHLPEFDLDGRNEHGHVDFVRMGEGGLDGAFFAAWIEPHFSDIPGGAYSRARELLELTLERVGESQGGRIVGNATELDACRAQGLKGVFLAVEGGAAIEASLERAGELIDLGIRYMTLTWNDPTEWADSCCAPQMHGGLTNFGREVIRTLSARGVLADLSHASDATFWDTLKLGLLPPLVSHSNARRLADHPRNLTDEMAREVAAAGGIVGLNFFPAFVDQETALAARRLHATLDVGASNREAWTAALRALPRPPLERLVDHFHHLADLAGSEFLALGSDFDGVSTLPQGLEDVASLPVLREALAGRGFSEGEIEGIFGGNFLRVLRSVDATPTTVSEHE